MHLPQSTAEDAAVFCNELMDLSDISSDLPDIMTTTSDDDIPDLVDIWTLNTWITSNTEYGLHKHSI